MKPRVVIYRTGSSQELNRYLSRPTRIGKQPRGKADTLWCIPSASIQAEKRREMAISFIRHLDRSGETSSDQPDQSRCVSPDEGGHLRRPTEYRSLPRSVTSFSTTVEMTDSLPPECRNLMRMGHIAMQPNSHWEPTCLSIRYR